MKAPRTLELVGGFEDASSLKESLRCLDQSIGLFDPLPRFVEVVLHGLVRVRIVGIARAQPQSFGGEIALQLLENLLLAQQLRAQTLNPLPEVSGRFLVTFKGGPGPVDDLVSTSREVEYLRQHPFGLVEIAASESPGQEPVVGLRLLEKLRGIGGGLVEHLLRCECEGSRDRGTSALQSGLKSAHGFESRGAPLRIEFAGPLRVDHECLDASGEVRTPGLGIRRGQRLDEPVAGIRNLPQSHADPRQFEPRRVEIGNGGAVRGAEGSLRLADPRKVSFSGVEKHSGRLVRELRGSADVGEDRDRSDRIVGRLLLCLLERRVDSGEKVGAERGKLEEREGRVVPGDISKLGRELARVLALLARLAQEGNHVLGGGFDLVESLQGLARPQVELLDQFFE